LSIVDIQPRFCPGCGKILHHAVCTNKNCSAVGNKFNIHSEDYKANGAIYEKLVVETIPPHAYTETNTDNFTIEKRAEAINSLIKQGAGNIEVRAKLRPLIVAQSNDLLSKGEQIGKLTEQLDKIPDPAKKAEIKLELEKQATVYTTEQLRLLRIITATNFSEFQETVLSMKKLTEVRKNNE